MKFQGSRFMIIWHRYMLAMLFLQCCRALTLSIGFSRTRSLWQSNPSSFTSMRNCFSRSNFQFSSQYSLLFAKRRSEDSDADDNFSARTSESGIYQFTGSSPPPELAKLFGIQTEKRKRPNFKKSGMKAKAQAIDRAIDKKSSIDTNTMQVDQPEVVNKKIKKNRNTEESLDDLERQLISKYGSMQDVEDPDYFDEEDEQEQKKKSKKAALQDLIARNNGYVLGAKMLANQDPSSETLSKESKAVKSKALPIDRAIRPDKVLENFNKLKSSFDNQGTSKPKMSLLDRAAKKLKTPSISQIPFVDEEDDLDEDINAEEETEKEDEEGVYSDDEVMQFVREIKSDKARWTKMPETAETNEPNAAKDLNRVPQPQSEVSYRFRKPPASLIQLEKDQLVAKEQKRKQEEEIKAERTKQAKLKAKEESKTEFHVFDFDDSDGNNSDIDDGETIFSKTSFESIGISNSLLLKNIEEMGIFVPTKIQEKIIPILLNKKSSSNMTRSMAVMQAMTGSGKTLGFLLPLFDVIDPKLDKVQTVIIAPSRELVTQISDVADRLFYGLSIRTVPIIGGANARNQVKRIREDKPHIIVATPGRLAEIVFGLQKLSFGMVRALIVDEIDNMLDEPFVGELETLLQAMPLFTRHIPVFVDDEDDDDIATGNNPSVNKFTSQITKHSWKMVTVDDVSSLSSPSSNYSPDEIPLDMKKTVSLLPSTITHGLISTPRIRALEYLKRFLNSKPEVKSAFIFVNDPHRVEVICDQLLEMGMIAAPLHGESSKEDRKEILARLRDGRVNLVVTTELAARGLDVPELTHVINFELPTDAQHYVHRAGRCGRAGRQGLVMNFANPNTKFVVRRFGKQLKIKIKDCELREGKVFLRSN